MSARSKRPPEAPVEATDPVWRSVHDAILGGLVHEAAGRQSALSSIRTLLELRSDRLDALPQLLDGEIESLAALTAQLRTLPRHWEQRDFPSVAEYLPRVASLAAQHRGLDQLDYRVAVDPGTPPPDVSRSGLTRALLVLLARAGRRAVEAGAGGVELEAGAGGHGLRIGVTVPLPGGSPREIEEPAGPGPEATRVVFGAVRSWGGEWVVEEDGAAVVCYRMEIPAGR